MIVGSALLGTIALWPAAASPASAGTGGATIAQAAPGDSYAKPKPPKCTYRCTNHRKFKCCPKCTRVAGKC
ncbi:hypothetical protein SAMN05421833_101336 [Microbispora rosea]|uniref:Uncharacterized protein n=1 Tax=Microbispora rosea TaxID=58117 RepID=A0A1N6RD36_9ACTN|nr:hypothetical protein SAMN05421833_101336 [Microbispora rosea]